VVAEAEDMQIQEHLHQVQVAQEEAELVVLLL
jgi:hypothetical protein